MSATASTFGVESRLAITCAALSTCRRPQRKFSSVTPVYPGWTDRSAAKYRQRGAGLYSVQDATIACAYAQLAATELGLGTVWVGAFDDDAVAKAVNAKPDWKPVAILPIGYAAEAPAATPRCNLTDLVHHHDQ